MKQINDFVILGTSHIAKQSHQEIEAALEQYSPSVICLELDVERLHALRHPSKARFSLGLVRQVGITGSLFVLLGSWAQRWLGKKVGMMPGGEMLIAYTLATKNNITIALIDQPIKITIRRLMKKLTWKEKWRMIWDVIEGVFFKKKALKKLGITTIDLTKVPEKNLIKQLLIKVKDRYPALYQVLVVERNHYMAKQLKAVRKAKPEGIILAIVGAGHEEGITLLLTFLLAGFLLAFLLRAIGSPSCSALIF